MNLLNLSWKIHGIYLSILRGNSESINQSINQSSKQASKQAIFYPIMYHLHFPHDPHGMKPTK